MIDFGFAIGFLLGVLCFIIAIAAPQESELESSCIIAGLLLTSICGLALSIRIVVNYEDIEKKSPEIEYVNEEFCYQMES